jgi:hypothetical protein
MFMKKNEQAFLTGLLAYGVAYAFLSHPKCQEACRSLFEPIASEAGRTIAAAAIGMLIARS